MEEKFDVKKRILRKHNAGANFDGAESGIVGKHESFYEIVTWGDGVVEA